MPEDDYKEFVLPPSVNEEILNQLDYPMALAKALKSERIISDSKKLTYLPAETKPEEAENYGEGPENIRRGPAIKWLIKKVQSYLRQGPNRVIVFQDPFADPALEYIKKWDFPFISFGEEVYVAVGYEHADDYEYIQKILRAVEAEWLVVAMSQLPLENLPFPSEFDDKIIRLIARNTDHFIVSAYDGSGYFLCSFV